MIRNEIHYAPILPRTSDITSISKWEPSSCYFEYYLGTYERVQFILKNIFISEPDLLSLRDLINNHAHRFGRA